MIYSLCDCLNKFSSKQMEEATPRGIIRGVLTTTSVTESGRSLRPRKTPRVTNTRGTPVNPPSHAEVATRILTRSRSANKRKAPSGYLATPADSTTPRTLIAGYLQTAPITVSVVKGKKQRKDKKEDDTPRAIIQNLLREAIAETPEEPIFSSDVEDNDVPQQTGDGDTHSLLTEEDKNDEHSVDMTTAHQAHEVTMTDAATGLLSSYQEGDHVVQSESGGKTEEPGNLSSVESAQVLPTDPMISDDGEATSRQWRDLVTPQLPLNVPSTAGSRTSRARINVVARSASERPFFGGKPPVGKVAGKGSTKSSGPRLPPTLVKSIFQHFSRAKLSKEAFQAVENGSNLFFKRLSSDLMAYCQHAHRSTIEAADVELLMRRQGFITENESLYSLVEKYLPLEYRQEIIPVVQAGNKILFK